MKSSALRNISFVTFLFIVIITVILFKVYEDRIDLLIIRENIENFGIWAPILFILFYIILTFFIPATPLMLLAGILFGFRYGLSYTIISGFLSSLILFGVSRKLGKSFVEKILQHRYLTYLDKYNQKLERSAIWDMIILRLTPILPFNILNILMGVSKITIRDYSIGTIIGLVPSNIITVYIGTLMTKIL